ncbi:MAG: phospho-N-acetylmuramoyl-pentapeptide-transferase [Calditrichaeota bacterium]|nr:phospho-N-acetylmuramoyl-pentapeptide-transferase [Calditrichota bacterium]
MLAELLYSLRDWFGALNVFNYITVRAALSFMTALMISWLVGARFIELLKKKQIKETIRKDGPENHFSKAGTPTMGGVIILVSIIVSTLAWAKLENIYIQLIFLATIWMGTVGFIDDYIKVVKKNKKGLAGRFKIAGQISIGLILGLTLSYHDAFADANRLAISVPFFKDTVVNFHYTWLYIIWVIFVITAMSNAVNLTDGLDGLASGTSAISIIGFAGIAYITGNVKYSDYLNIMYLTDSGELTVFCVAVFGAALGFLWFNSYPAQVFMGDTGSLALGSAIGTMAILLKKELWLLLICGIFVVETLSVVIQTSYFKYSRKKYGEGRRVFLMAPIHHHFEKKGISEPKLVMRFMIVGVFLLLTTLVTFKTQ